MAVEREPPSEVIRPGQLYFLAHPESDLFSGYGLTTHDGRNDRLVGLLMVDRPQRADPAWLAELEHRYGDYQLLPMTARGERGLLAQMRVAAGSLALLERFDHPIAAELSHVLQPVLDALPSPILKVRWDDEQKLWVSDFWVGLPAEMQAVFDKMGYGCFAAERDDDSVAFLTHVAPADLLSLRYAPVVYDWQMIPMPTAPLIRFTSAVLDDPNHPYRLEHFLNVEDVAQSRCLARLAAQKELVLDFYGVENEYAFSKRFAHPDAMRARLAILVQQAIAYDSTIPAHRRDFDQAKAAFQRTFPV